MQKKYSLFAGAIIALGLALTQSSPAQTNYSSNSASGMLSVGLQYLAGVSSETNAPEGTKIPPVYSWRTGVASTYPFTPTFSATLDLGLESRAVKTRSFNDQYAYDIARVTYFFLTPGMRFSAFTLGLNIGFPTGGEVVHRDNINTAETINDLSTAQLEGIS